MRSRQVVHVRHLADLRDRRCANKALLLVVAHAGIILLILGVLVLSLCLFLTIKHGKTLLELVVLHAELATDGNKAAQAVNVVLVLLVDLLVHLECFVE